MKTNFNLERAIVSVDYLLINDDGFFCLFFSGCSHMKGNEMATYVIIKLLKLEKLEGEETVDVSSILSCL